MSNRVLIPVLACLLAKAMPCCGAEQTFYVSPTGDDAAAGAAGAPFRTVHQSSVL